MTCLCKRQHQGDKEKKEAKEAQMKTLLVEFNRWYVVLAENATNIGIIDGGIMDSQGLKFVKKFNEVKNVMVRKNVMVSWNRTGACLGDKCSPRLIIWGLMHCTWEVKKKKRRER